ncbi:interleukin-5 receptor subunit alpha-like isoform X1 [Scyliorhinus torazame]|uniref:interleukin-5 receptor subunit alpha-like isoform X1 n=1 Tax=Scyliorhinus torazame TaxID=75743 RepID=UPI003B593845
MPLAPSFLKMTIVWAITANGVALMSLEETIRMNPPTDIKIAPGRLGEYIVSWSGNCTCTNGIYYHFNHRYLGSKDPEKHDENAMLIQTHEVKLDVELDRGIFVQIQLYQANEEISSNWTETIFHPSRDSFAPVDNLTCIFDDNYMNCTWNITENAPQDAEHFLSYRMENANDINNCTNYQRDEQGNVACRGHKYEKNLVSKLNICVSESSNRTKLPYCRNIIPAFYYKLDTPINITINKDTNEVEWKLPKMHYSDSCYTYEINLTDWSDPTPKVKNVSSTKYVISRDHEKRYSVQVRGTVNRDCHESLFWSEWSKPFHIEPDAKVFDLLTILAAVGVFFVGTVLVLIFFCTRFKLWSKVCQPIPDPKDKFNGLFEDYDGDFQKWINKNPILMTKTEECIPVIVKEV